MHQSIVESWPALVAGLPPTLRRGRRRAFSFQSGRLTGAEQFAMANIGAMCIRNICSTTAPGLRLENSKQPARDRGGRLAQLRPAE